MQVSEWNDATINDWMGRNEVQLSNPAYDELRKLIQAAASVPPDSEKPHPLEQHMPSRAWLREKIESDPDLDPEVRPPPDSGVAVAWTYMPSVGRVPMTELIEAVAEASIGNRKCEIGIDLERFIGHQMVPPINFNSLNRIVSAFLAHPSKSYEDGIREEVLAHLDRLDSSLESYWCITKEGSDDRLLAEDAQDAVKRLLALLPSTGAGK